MFSKGLTLIELLIVIVILAILVVLVLPLTLVSYKNQQLDSVTREIIQTLRRAQLKSMSVENDSSFGVYLTDDNYTLFQGESFQERDIQYDEVFELPSTITVSEPYEIVFSKFEGLPSQTGNIVLRNNGSERIININKIGRINLEV